MTAEWHLEHLANLHYFVVLAENGEEIAGVPYAYADDERIEAERIARLFIAAPKLAAALSSLLDWADSDAVAGVLGAAHAGNCGCAEIVEGARAALELAGGGQQ